MKRRLATVFLSLLLISGLASVGTAFRLADDFPNHLHRRFRPASVNPSGQTIVSQSQGLSRVQSLFQTWQSVPTAAIAFSYAGPITGITGDDVKTIQDFHVVQGSCNNGVQNPIIFDANGSLIRALGLDPLVIGFAATCKLDSQNGHISSATCSTI